MLPCCSLSRYSHYHQLLLLVVLLLVQILHHVVLILVPGVKLVIQHFMLNQADLTDKLKSHVEEFTTLSLHHIDHTWREGASHCWSHWVPQQLVTLLL